MSVDFILGRSDEWQPEYKNTKELTGLSDESIASLKKCYKDWHSNSITRTINVLLKDKKTLYNIGQYLFGKLDEAVQIEIKYDLAKPDSEWTTDQTGYYVDSPEYLDVFDEERLKKIFLFEVQTNLENILKNQCNKKESE